METDESKAQKQSVNHNFNLDLLHGRTEKYINMQAKTLKEKKKTEGGSSVKQEMPRIAVQ